MSSFHSLDDQEQYEKYGSLSNAELISECIDKDTELTELKALVAELEKWQECAFEIHPNINIDMETILGA